MANKSVPCPVLLQNLFANLRDSCFSDVRQKLYDANRMRSTAADPHYRTITLNSYHRTIFSGAFGSQFRVEERSLTGVDLEQSSPKFNLLTLERLEALFSTDSIIKCHKIW